MIAAPVAYLAALGLTIWTWGLPLAKDQLFLWLALGMAASTVRSFRRWPSLLLDWAPLFGLLVGYDFLRGAVSVPEAQAHLLPQLDLDRALFGGDGPTLWLQQQLWDPLHLHAWDYAVWCVYMSHFFVVWIVAAVLWRRSRATFHRWSALVVTVTFGAFLTYWLYPAQPPWMAADNGVLPRIDRVVPTVWGELGVRTVSSLYEDGRLVNTVAAVPSLHAAYPVALLVFFWGAGWLVRAGLATYASAMAFALVYGGEHFAADIFAGWGLVGLAVALLAGARLAWARVRAPARPTRAGERARDPALQRA